MILKIRLIGCDDETEVEVEATADDLEFLKNLEVVVNKAAERSNCMPSLDVTVM